MRVFFSHDKSCEFIPRGPEDVAGAAQATELVSWYLEQSNAYSVFADAIKDCLIKGEGIIKVWHETQYDIQTRELQGLNELQIGLFVQEGYEVTSSEELEDAPGLYNVVLTRRVPRGKIRLECLPPEEFLINRTATSLDDAKIVAHRQLLRVGDLVELGYPYETIIEFKGYEDDFRSNEEWNLRHPNWREEDDTDSDPSNRLVQYVESFVRVDADGDGVPELRRICTIGQAHEILMNEPVDSHPFLLIRKDPLQHTWRGMSLYDELADIQRIKSAVMRNMLDSLSLSTRPRILYDEVNGPQWEDVSNDEIGALIPTRNMGGMQMLEMPFVGGSCLPILNYLDQIKETRTGISKASQGLDAEHLQSTTAIAVSASQKAAQARLELIARNIAESGFKPLYKRLLQLTLLHMDQPTVMRLRGEFVQVDPQGFADYDVLITLPLGRGSEEERRQALLGLLGQAGDADPAVRTHESNRWTRAVLPDIAETLCRPGTGCRGRIIPQTSTADAGSAAATDAASAGTAERRTETLTRGDAGPGRDPEEADRDCPQTRGNETRGRPQTGRDGSRTLHQTQGTLLQVRTTD
jgi:hypothetical protein